MRRWNIDTDNGEPFEWENGEFVMWEDVKLLVEEVIHLRKLVAVVCDPRFGPTDAP